MMRSLVIWSIVGAVLAASVGCDSVEEPTAARPDPILASDWDAWPGRTDSLVYHLRREPGEYRAYASVTLRNRTGGPIHFARCMPGDVRPMFWLSRTGPDSTARLFVDWAWACVGGVPTGELAPGNSVVVRVPLGSIDQPNMSPPLRPEHLVGLLRVRFHLCRARNNDSDYCEPVPQADAQSNAFEVRY